jgi:hypothetical protein
MPVFLRVQSLRRAAQAEAGRLLRILFLWNGKVPARTAGVGLLQPIVVIRMDAQDK